MAPHAPFTKWVVGLRLRVSENSLAYRNQDFDVTAQGYSDAIREARRIAYNRDPLTIGAPVSFVRETE